MFECLGQIRYHTLALLDAVCIFNTLASDLLDYCIVLSI